MVKVIEFFKIMIMVQLFFAIGITLFAYSIPDKNYVNMFSTPASSINLQTTSEKVQSSIEQQTNIPVIDVGALVFYSGNIILDLLLNFAFAIPEMIGLLITGITNLLNLDSVIMQSVQLFASVAIMVTYFISLMQLLSGIRSGRVI